MEKPCIHRPLTTKHLSVSWCSSCQDWLVHSSQSGRRDASGGIVLIEVLEIGSLGYLADDPADVADWFWRFLFSCIELEDDRRDTDSLRPPHLRSV